MQFLSTFEPFCLPVSVGLGEFPLMVGQFPLQQGMICLKAKDAYIAAFIEAGERAAGRQNESTIK